MIAPLLMLAALALPPMPSSAPPSNTYRPGPARSWQWGYPTEADRLADRPGWVWGWREGPWIRMWPEEQPAPQSGLVGATNYGVDLSSVGQATGKIETNDPNFGGRFFGPARAGSRPLVQEEVPLPDDSGRPCPSPGPEPFPDPEPAPWIRPNHPYILPAALVVAAVILGIASARKAKS